MRVALREDQIDLIRDCLVHLSGRMEERLRPASNSTVTDNLSHKICRKRIAEILATLPMEKPNALETERS
ncbi:MAG: hypothetical protein AABZ67_00445 [Pseudomonadota bacterium]